MKLTCLLQGTGFAKILALNTAFYWEGINKTPGNYCKLNRPGTLTLQALHTSLQQQLFKTNPYSGVRLIVTIQPFLHL